jgi:oxygen-independent coproporphyrinogen-3 oxidase
MILEVLNHSFHYEMENLCRAFYQNEKIKTLRSLAVSNEETIITTTIHAKDCGADMEVRIRCSADNYDAHRIISVSSDIAGFAEECERSMAVALFELLRGRNGLHPSWVLTGVRLQN